jgi:hypothetical protein
VRRLAVGVVVVYVFLVLFLVVSWMSLQDALEDLVIEVSPDGIAVLVQLFGEIACVVPRVRLGKECVLVVVVPYVV